MRDRGGVIVMDDTACMFERCKRVEVLRSRVVRPVFSLPRRNRLGVPHPQSYCRGQGRLQDLTMCWRCPRHGRQDDLCVRRRGSVAGAVLHHEVSARSLKSISARGPGG